MARRSAQAVRRDTDSGYLRLVRAFPLRPIRSDDELDHAIEVINSLLTRDHLDAGEKDYLQVLGDLIHQYESKHHPVATVSDVEMLEFLLAEHEMTQAELARRSAIAESTISAILAGKRMMGRSHIAAFSLIFHVSPAVFFPEATEMTPERAAETLGRRGGLELSGDLLVSLASAFAQDPDRGCWRAFQELVDGERPGPPAPLMAERLNSWGQQLAGSSCWWPVPLGLTGPDLEALSTAFAAERDCWRLFRRMVEEALPEMREIQRGVAEEN